MLPILYDHCFMRPLPCSVTIYYETEVHENMTNTMRSDLLKKRINRPKLPTLDFLKYVTCLKLVEEAPTSLSVLARYHIDSWQQYIKYDC